MSEPYPPTPSTDAAQALDELRSLPSLEETTTQVQGAIDEITSAATRLVPGIQWAAAPNAGEGNCKGPYEQTDGRRYFLPNQVADSVSVSETHWDELVNIARESAAKLGATDEQVMQDQPGHHDVWFTGPAGVFIKFSYRGNMVVAGHTGCRLPQDKK